jgi:diguanylate cyclase (GGDEF)-like protein
VTLLRARTEIQPMQFYLPDVPCPMLLTDAQGKILVANAELQMAVDGSQRDWPEQSMDALLTPASAILCQTHVWPMLLRDGRVNEIYLELKSGAGARVPVMTNARLVNRDGQNRVIWIFFVAQERSQFATALLESKKQAESLAVELAQAKAMLVVLNSQLEARVERTEEDNLALTHLSTTDTLTGLGNRRALDQFTQTLVSQRNPNQSMLLSVLMVDVDHFKRVNDTRGHDVGDQVLSALAHCLRDCARQRDAVVRYGGEEFTMLLPHTDAQQAELLAQRLHERVRVLNPAGIAITISIGIATGYLTTTEDITSLITRADTAVYQAKHDGRNCTRVETLP